MFRLWTTTAELLKLLPKKFPFPEVQLCSEFAYRYGTDNDKNKIKILIRDFLHL